MPMVFVPGPTAPDTVNRPTEPTPNRVVPDFMSTAVLVFVPCMMNVPLLIVVAPLYVLAPVKISVPASILFTPPATVPIELATRMVPPPWKSML
ncbi:MAG: hypothetical protein BWY59_01531 [Verrucomicrobia bacterium ADurb.Bin345]|nr:MAG: hypothetical protein BWY59_01531 [Verrucomicrobia bacterium ADurb.Bin345]